MSNAPGCRRAFVLVGLACGLSGTFAARTSADELRSGAAVYEAMCVRCHGADGQGVAGTYEVPLAGARSVVELTRLIDRTMPDDEPEACTGDEARQVAQFIYDEFYSPAARLRKGLDEPVHVELMRLTVDQYRNAIADLIGSFTPSPADARRLARDQEPGRRRQNRDERPNERPDSVETPQEVQPGLRASYYRSKGMSKADDLALERVDASIDFDFQSEAPSEGIAADQFAIVWDGALETVEAGEYQFRVTTPNGARLYLNNDATRGLRKLRDDSSAAGQSALIDAWVSSGKVRDESASVYLLGGRRFPLRLEFFKYQEKTASIKLEWKPPHGVWSVLDHHALTTAEIGRTFVVETPFPADDRSLGYERGRSVSHEWQMAATDAAILAAEEVVNRLPLLAGDVSPSDRPETPDGPADEATAADIAAAEAAAATARQLRLQDFVVRFATLAFRHPLSDDQQSELRELPFAAESSPEAAVRRAIVWILSSPDFLYADLTPTDQQPGSHAVAARLALALWDSLPDTELTAAANAGELASPDQVERQARRMLQDPRARHKMRGFLRHWLELEERDLSKDKAMFPEFDEHVIADLRRSLELFLEEVIWSETSDYRQLLSADYLLLNHRLADVYRPISSGGPATSEVPSVATGSSPPPFPDFHRVTFPSHERAGVLTHPYLLSALAYHNNSSPIHRGVFLTRNIVGRALKPPPVAVAFKNDEFAPELTMREKITQLTRDSNCMACHSVINPLGFAMEHYDAVGRWRTNENNKPVDSKSQYTTENGDTVEVDSARDIASLALSSESAHRAFLVQLCQHLTKQNPAAYGPSVVEQLRTEFAANAFHVQNLMIRIAVMAALHGPAPESVPAAGPPACQEAKP